ncbi:SGNH/GDSL hydrolase family protein [Micromonospora vinacea]|uniref:Lysophospholipase L1-like esterase n=1 Tax=Micromonospora vinacea TaxID=709878 RepID=A0ABS0K5K0_9ACTN|nr:SGNH/GDSL hydrolase family protein [Micromonospora vinacea]MBG6103877.1 lysophospholipase L1-like esterase [Micromonospora vinacea]WSZ79841.1 SGNH/GDSL hydrolase family protein [Micromonospora sp. NBC_00860]WTA70069.1 SGNH/GDSL hydrolase family protein [Micromonospora sp. NBC_00855]
MAANRWLPRFLRQMPRLPDAAGDHLGEASGDGPVIRMVIVGDSAVTGVGADHLDGALAGQLATAVAGLTGRRVCWRVLGRTGARARTLDTYFLRHLSDPCTQWRPDLVVVSIGVNDVTRLLPPWLWERDLLALIDRIRHRLDRSVPILFIQLPPVRQFIGLPAPLRRSLGLLAERYNRRLRLLARRDPDVYRLPADDLLVPLADFFASDGFHPSQIGYRAWARSIASQIATVVDLRAGRSPATARSGR